METLELHTIERIISAIKDAERNGTVKFTGSEILSGFSGNKLIGVLQRLSALYAGDQHACYLEVGVFQGLSMLSVAGSNPDLPCYGIDNFTYFDPRNENLELNMRRIAQLELNNVTILDKDYEDALEEIENYLEGREIAVYFIDGPHDYRSQLMGLELALPFTHDEAVIVVDDCNYRHIRQANRDFLHTHPDWKLVFEAYTPCHPHNMKPEHYQQAREGWWNGVNIIVHDRSGKLKPMDPPTERSRKVFENEQLIHSSRIAEMAPAAVYFVQAMLRLNLFGMVRKLTRLIRLYLKGHGIYRSRFTAANTYSDQLPEANYNELIS